jgi:hypothetical protein
VLESRTNRRRVAAHALTLRAALPTMVDASVRGSPRRPGSWPRWRSCQIDSMWQLDSVLPRSAGFGHRNPPSRQSSRAWVQLGKPASEGRMAALSALLPPNGHVLAIWHQNRTWTVIPRETRTIWHEGAAAVPPTTRRCRAPHCRTTGASSCAGSSGRPATSALRFVPHVRQGHGRATLRVRFVQRLDKAGSICPDSERSP